jgi:uncharacterized protein YegP (UPF0339 family)
MIYTNRAEIVQDKKGKFRLKSGQEIYPETYRTRSEAIAAIKAIVDNTIEINQHFGITGTQHNCLPDFTHYTDENGNEIAASDTVFFEEEADEAQILMFKAAERATAPVHVH